jgi:hypothetical protein
MNQDLSGATSPNLHSDESSVSGGELGKIDAYWRANAAAPSCFVDQFDYDVGGFSVFA